MALGRGLRKTKWTLASSASLTSIPADGARFASANRHALKSYELQVEASRPKPNVRAYISTRSRDFKDPVILWHQALNALTSPRFFGVFLANTGQIATGPYRFSVYAPEGMTFAYSNAGHPLPELQLAEQRLDLDGRRLIAAARLDIGR